VTLGWPRANWARKRASGARKPQEEPDAERSRRLAIGLGDLVERLAQSILVLPEAPVQDPALPRRDQAAPDPIE